MPIQQYPNGIGASTGDSLVLAKPLAMSGNVWYVSSTTGVDAASPAGRNREEPLATILQAVTNAVANDIIVLMDGHTETLTAVLSLAAAVTIVGEGSSGGLPTANLTMNGAGARLSLAAGCKVRNVWFKPRGNASADESLTIGAASCEVRGCYFQAGANDSVGVVAVNATANNCRIVNCTFLSAATSLSAQPSAALMINAAVSDLDIEGCSFDAGTHGFTGATLDGSAAATTRLRGEGISLLRGADVTLHASTTGYFNVQTCTGGSRLSW